MYQIRLLGGATTHITDLNGNILDGDNDSKAGGDYVATFTIMTPQLQVTALTPLPGSTQNAPPAAIVVTLNKVVDPSTVNLNTVVLTRAGADGVLATGDDVTIAPAQISRSSPNSVTIDLTGVVLPDDLYRIRLLGGTTTHIADLSGKILDGDGDGIAGGGYVAGFKLQRPPVANPGTLVTDENKIAFGTFSATSSSGAPLTYQIVTNGAKGSAAVVPGTNFFSFSPNFDTAGLDLFTFKANDGISDSNVAIVAVGINAVNLTPIIISPAAAAPNPVVPDKNVLFTAAASNPDGTALNYIWDFGDGAQGAGSSANHTYNTVGLYTASVAIYGSSGTAVASFVTVNVTVSAMSLNPASETAQSMSVAKMGGAVNFAKTSKDTIYFSGVIPNVPAAFVPAGAILKVDAGGAQVSFTLDNKGKAQNARGTLQLKLSAKKPGFIGGNLPFSLKLANGDWAAAWGMAPGDGKTKQMPVSMVIIINLNGTEYATTVNVTYSPGAKSGKFKK